MKTLIAFVIILLSSTNYPKNPLGTNDFIKIKHTGMQEKGIKSLFISTKKMNFESDLDLKEIIDNKRAVTSEQKNDFLNLLCNFSITDKITYQTIIDFVNGNKSFFTNNINKNHGDYRDYSITVKGKVYDIFYKKKNQFFSNLIICLKTKKCDKLVIKKLSIY